MVELRKEEEILTDYHLMVYYNPYFFKWRIVELRAELSDIYSSSASKHEYTKDGIIVVASSTEKLAMRSAVIKESIENRTKEFEAHTENLKAFMRHCNARERKQIKKYFHSQFHDEILHEYKVIDRIKIELYAVEVEQREDRQKNFYDLLLNPKPQPTKYRIKREKLIIK